MVPALVNEVSALLTLIMKTIQKCEQKTQNTSALKDLRKFLQGLNVSIDQLQKKVLVTNLSNSAMWALEAVKTDLEVAVLEANKLWEKGYFHSVWNSRKIESKIRALRERVMTSFQTRLSLASFDVELETKIAQDAYQTAMLEVNKNLEDLFISTTDSVKAELHLAIRRELGQALKTLTDVAKESQTHRVESAILMIQSVPPQTSDAEKFREDVLAALKFSPVEGRSSNSACKWYEDPITWETMCDPVKATDGFTYDRWTILGKLVDGKLEDGLSKSPFKPYDPRPFGIVEDDLSTRSRLFCEFSSQRKEFQECRAAYRKHALNEVKLQHFGDAAMMLEHVLEWAPQDLECIQKLRDVHKIIDDLDDTELPALETGQGSRSKQPNPSRLVSASSGASLLELSQFEDYPLDHLMERPSRLIIPSGDVGHLVSLSPNGLTACYNPGQASDKVVALQANCVGWPLDASQRFYFEAKIVGKGRHCSIVIGFAHSDCFSEVSMPGSYINSCGYHVGDGKLFIGYPTVSQEIGPTFSSNDIIGVGIDYARNTIFFTKNGMEVGHTSRWLRLSCTLRPVVGLCRRNAAVCLNFGHEPFSFDARIRRPLKLDMVEQQAATRALVYCNDSAEVSSCEEGLQVRYKGGKVAAVMADPTVCSTSPRKFKHMHYFELKVCKVHERGSSIGIGFCRQDVFRSDEMPGWYPGSYGYHGDDGQLFTGQGTGRKFWKTFFTGDTVGAGLDFEANVVFFVINGRRIAGQHPTGDLKNQPYSFCPLIGLQRAKEKVLLNFGGSHEFAWDGYS